MNTSQQHPTTKIRTVIAAIAVASVPVTAIAAPAALGIVPTSSTSQTALAAKATARAACATGWGSLAEARNRATLAAVRDVRTGRHACYDRLVIDIAGRATGYDVRYVPQVRQDGSGLLVPLRGGARLQVVVRAPAHTDAGKPTYQPRSYRELSGVAGYKTFRQVAWAGSFEGQTMVGLGVRARLPFRVFTLPGPGSHSRVVVDVAHRW